MGVGQNVVSNGVSGSHSKANTGYDMADVPGIVAEREQCCLNELFEQVNA